MAAMCCMVIGNLQQVKAWLAVQDGIYYTHSDAKWASVDSCDVLLGNVDIPAYVSGYCKGANDYGSKKYKTLPVKFF